MKYRIIKRTDVYYHEDKPVRRYWYVIQRKIVTCVCLWIPFWMDMQFDDYGSSKMTFDTLEEAKDYLIKITQLPSLTKQDKKQ